MGPLVQTARAWLAEMVCNVKQAINDLFPSEVVYYPEGI
jgi:hypothetical protein